MRSAMKATMYCERKRIVWRVAAAHRKRVLACRGAGMAGMLFSPGGQGPGDRSIRAENMRRRFTLSTAQPLRMAGGRGSEFETWRPCPGTGSAARLASSPSSPF